MPHVWTRTDNLDWNKPSGRVIGSNQPHAGSGGVVLQEVYLRCTTYDSGGQRNYGPPLLGKWSGDDWKLIFERRGRAVTDFNARVTVTDWGVKSSRRVWPEEPYVESPNHSSIYVDFQFAVVHYAYFDACPEGPPWVFPALSGGYGQEIVDLYNKGALPKATPKALRGIVKWN